MSHILLTGATGFIGRHLVFALLNKGHQVTACSRSAASLQRLYGDKVTPISIDFANATSPQDWLSYLEDNNTGVDVVINAAGIITETATQSFDDIHTNAPVALFNACVDAGVNRVIQVSALGADTEINQNQNDNQTAHMSHYHQSKQAADDVLMSLPLDWFVLRPSIIYGDGAKSMGLFQALSILPLVPLVGSGKQLIQPIHIDDVVASIIAAIDSCSTAQKQIDLVGSSVISYASFMQKMRAWLNDASATKQPFRTFKMSLGVSKQLVKLGRLISEPALNPETMQMLDHSKVYNVAEVETHLQRPLQSLDQYLQNNPVTQAQRWHSRLYLLRPLMRYVLAFVWIWTGIVSAFLYPQEQSYQLLSAVGISGVVLPIMLYSAAFIDFIIGISVLFAWRVRLVAQLQIGMIVIYTIIISFALPDFWLHPFGPILKNLPLLIFIVIWSVLEEQKP